MHKGIDVNRDLSPAALLTCAQMSACDAWTIKSKRFTGIELMEAAGAAIMDVVLRDFACAAGVDVLCGPGNNGGDGYVVARLLRDRGLAVRVFALGNPKTGTDAEKALAAWNDAVSTISTFAPKADHLVIDALFGAGFSGKMPEAAVKPLKAASEMGASILAVDLPSGVNGDTGLSDWTPQCAATTTFFRKKPAHCLQPSRAMCGTIHLADIGVVATPDMKITTHENKPYLWQDGLLAHPLDAHKYSRGHVVVFSGPRHATGASRLSAMAAARSGAGAATLLGTPGALDIHAAHVTSIMLRPCQADDRVGAVTGLTKPRAVVLGPGFGLGETTCQTAIDLLAAAEKLGVRTIVLDADGLTSFKEQPATLFAAIQASSASVILTPHEGEFHRLFPDIAADVELGKTDKASRAAKQSGAIIVLKGPDTIIAAPDGQIAINTNATRALATAGSGDVLAGICASLAAQSMPAFKSACAAVWLHAEAGREAGSVSIAEDLVRCIPAAISRVTELSAPR